MAVIEYKHHVFLNDHRRHIPGFVNDPDHWHNPVNHSFVGWAKDNADYYIPWSSLKVLTKEDFVQRCFTIHQTEPISIMLSREETLELPSQRTKQLTTEAEVREHAEKWYDDFVARNSV